MYDNDNDFDCPSHLDKNERTRKPRKAKRHDGGDNDRFESRSKKSPYDKSQRRQRFDY